MPYIFRNALFFRTVCKIILCAFVWTTFAPGIALAAKSGQAHASQKAITQKPLKSVAVATPSPVKGKKAAKTAAASAIPVQDVTIRISKDDGSVVDIAIGDGKNSKQIVVQGPSSSPKTVQSKAGSSSFARRIDEWPGEGPTHEIPANPPNIRTYASGNGPTGEDLPREELRRYESVSLVNPTSTFGEGEGCYISIPFRFTSSEEATNTVYDIDGTGPYLWAVRHVYSSWSTLENGELKKYCKLNQYRDGQYYWTSGVQVGWMTGYSLTWRVLTGPIKNKGTWHVDSYEGLSTSATAPTPGTALANQDFPWRILQIKPGKCSSVFAPTLGNARINFSLVCWPDNWSPGTATYKIRLLSRTGATTVIKEGSIDGTEAAIEWDGKDMSATPQYIPQGTYWMQVRVLSESEHACSIAEKDDGTYSAWQDLGSIVVLTSEKGVGNQCLNKGEPVNVSSGNYYTEAQDLMIPARGIPFSVTRYHNSLIPQKGLFGYGWSSNLFPTLIEFDSGDVQITNPDGEVNTYKKTTGGYTSMPGVFSTLTKNGDGTYLLSHKDLSTTTFTAKGLLSQLKDPNANTLTYAYDSNGLLTTITDRASRSITFAYDDTPRITSITDFANRVIQYQYDESGNLALVLDPMGLGTRYTYNSEHQIVTIQDPRGTIVVNNTYNADTGQVTSQSVGDGSTFAYAYDTTARTATVTTGSQVSTYYYDVLDNLTKEVDPLGNAIVYAYDANRNLTQVTDPLGRATSYEYDADGNRTAIVNAAGKRTTMAYNLTFNKPTLIRTALSGQVTRFAYNGKGNLVKITDPLGKITTMTYDGHGQLTQTTDPLGNSTSYDYNARGNMISSTNALGKTTTFNYSAVGNLVKIIDPLGHTVTKVYDNNDRLIRVRDPLDSVTSFSYDNNGNLTSVKDAMGRITSYGYDAMDRLTNVLDAKGGNTAYEYDSYGNMTLMRDANARATSYAFDGGNRLTTVTDPLSRSTAFTYDAGSNLTGRTDAKGQAISYQYDVLNRLTSKSGAISVSYKYDVIGRRISMTDGTGKTVYEYDLANRLTKVTTPDQKSLSYAFDDAGKLVTLTDAENVATVYTYDAANRLTQAQRGANTVMYGYDDAGRPTNKTFPNGVQGQFSYDDANHLTSISYLASGNPLWSGQYTYNKVGNRITRTVGSTTLNYGYDKLDRLVWVKNGATTLSSYQYDPVGNRTRKAAGGKSTLYSYDAANQMTTAGSASYSYDQNGNLSMVQNGGATTYTFDGEDRLTGITFPDASTNAFVYNGDGLRVRATSKSGAETRYVWSGSDVINEYDGSVALSKSYHLGAGLEGQCVGSGAAHYYSTDGLGSVMSLTDEAGLATDTYEFDEFGVQTAATGTTSNVYRYTGQQRDGESGLYYLRARYYDPATGRFISQDPYKGNSKNPKTFNLYVYCQNNPLKFIDPTGYDSITILVTPNLDNYSNDAINKLKNGKENDVQSITLSTNYDLNAKILYNALMSSDYIIIRAHGGFNSLGYFFSFEGDKGDGSHAGDGNPYLTPNDFTIALSGITGDTKAKMLFLDACGSAEINNNKFFGALRSKKIRCCGSGIHQYVANTPLEIIHALTYATNSTQMNNILEKFNSLRSTGYMWLPKR